MQFHSFTTSVESNILDAVPTKKEKLPLSVTHPELAKEANGWDPSKFTFGSEFKVDWVCDKGHTWTSNISNRARKGAGCPICSGRTVLVGFNDLESQMPEVAKSAFEWDPSTVTVFSNKNMRWVCEIGHVTYARVANKAIRGNYCPVCTGHQVLKGFNDLNTTHPDVGNQASGWDPESFTAGSSVRKKWKCSIGHSWITSISNRTGRGDSCPICSGKKVLEGFNDICTTHPELLIDLLNKSDGKRVNIGSDKKLQWKCARGHRWSSTASNRRNGQGCPTCAPSGFDPNIPAVVYLLENPNLDLLKVGITNTKNTKRIDKHKRGGWIPVDIRGPMDGHLAQGWESSILRMLKAKGADLSNEKITGKFDGYSEAWSKSTFEVKSIKELMKLTEEFEEKK
jgi:translation initiation factor IF-1